MFCLCRIKVSHLSLVPRIFRKAQSVREFNWKIQKKSILAEGESERQEREKKRNAQQLKLEKRLDDSQKKFKTLDTALKSIKEKLDIARQALASGPKGASQVAKKKNQRANEAAVRNMLNQSI